MWSSIDTSQIEIIQVRKTSFVYKSKPLQFQIPRGFCKYGVGSFKSFQVQIDDLRFIEWYQQLEKQLCTSEPFASNLKDNILRIKIDDSTFVFDKDKNQEIPEIVEGLFQGDSVSCMITIDSSYFYNDIYGLVVKAKQVRYYHTDIEEEEAPSLGGCMFSI